MPELMERLRDGESVALVSDAGTPVLSDPGLELIQACIDDHLPVEPVPGPSAPLTALVASGFQAEPLMILGFVPPKANDRIRWLTQLREVAHTVIFFEAPHRIRATLRAFIVVLGNRPLCIGRELTKVHQEFIRGTAFELVERQIESRGEFTVVVGPAREAPQNMPQPIDEIRLTVEFRHLTEFAALTRRQAISELSRRYGRPSREIYASLEHAKGTLP
jgi:16S rRNA (cytidine1402-2'-O)-methyltransferase